MSLDYSNDTFTNEFGGAPGERFFSFIDNAWVSRNRQIVSTNRCMSAVGTDIWREIRYDTGDIRYVAINGYVNSPSAQRVSPTSAVGWTYCNCPF